MRRRQFLSHLCTLPATYALAHHAQAKDWNTPSNSSDEPPRYLLMIELIGGNDAWNTLIPWQDPSYYDLRPTLALPKDHVLRLNEQFALHPALEPLMSFWDKRQLALLLDVGYPDLAQTHFRASEIWDTASLREDNFGSGWVSTLLPPDHYFREYVARAICIGDNPGPMEHGEGVLHIDSLETLLKTQRHGIQSPAIPGSAMLSHILQVQANIARDATIPNNRFEDTTPERYAGFPRGQFGQHLQDVVAMINHSCAAPVIKLSLSGFDTHYQQAAQHEHLLAELASGLQAFRDTLHDQGFWPQVAVMVYSEFNRSLAENRTQGTEHGGAQPVMLLGHVVDGGQYGDYVPAMKRARGNFFQTDFRQVYNTLAHDWLGTRSRRLNMRQFPPMDIIDASYKSKRVLL